MSAGGLAPAGGGCASVLGGGPGGGVGMGSFLGQPGYGGTYGGGLGGFGYGGGGFGMGQYGGAAYPNYAAVAPRNPFAGTAPTATGTAAPGADQTGTYLAAAGAAPAAKAPRIIPN